MPAEERASLHSESSAAIGVVNVVVATLTYKRPRQLEFGLPEVLSQVEELNARPDLMFRARVLVVDNDPDASAQTIVERFGRRDILSYVVESKPGIAAARNRALVDSSDVDLLAFVDDDERPRRDWLAHLLEQWNETRPTAVAGKVVSVFSTQPDPWVAAGRFFSRLPHTSGEEVSVAATNNLLLNLNQIRSLGLRFDNELGLSGGEDNLFSRQLVQRGGRIVWSDEAVLEDQVPQERVTRRWLLSRAWSHGNSAAVVDIRFAGSLGEKLGARLKALAGGTGRIVFGVGRYLFGLATSQLGHQARGLRAAHKGGGMVSGAFGKLYQEYARTDEPS